MDIVRFRTLAVAITNKI